jgi:integrase
VNPFDGVERNKTVREARYVTDADMELALRVGRSKGGARLVVALALQCAWLCVRRSVEVRALTLQQITDAGIEWISGKRRKTDLPQTVLIEWTPALQQCIDEARAVKRDKVAGTMYVFGNMRGQRYTKGGWKAMLDDLMAACEETAAREGVPFKRFNLQDCRPKGASDKLATQQQDTQDALGHTDGRMLALHYDRRRVKVAKPVK